MQLGIKKNYISVTTRNLGIRLKELKYNVNKGLSRMAQAEGSIVKWEEADIVKSLHSPTLAMSAEKIEIYKGKLQDTCINARDAEGLSSAWKLLFNKQCYFMKLNSREIGIEFMEDFVKTNCFLDRGPLEIIWSEGFEVGAVIGKGAYSTVRIAEKNGNPIAIKIISIKDISKRCRDYFLPREIEVLSQLIHPNIIAIHRIMFAKNHIYIFMEFAEKGDLQDYIQRKQFLPDKKAKKYFRFLVKAMDYLHSQNISHRDLKCENLLITSNDTIKLTDFGFCRSVIDDKTGKRVLSETYCGSPSYSAPEVLQGIPYNPIMSDNWSIGVILYNMITGRLPFSESHHRKMNQISLRDLTSNR
ncbi:testis-specific serine/threonine-protein kinase 3-like [Centruroides vittatus]|uniref:testis-specific serine/threonine-protein kinase 3-like n=1 Tax=Centruroides vittatus TaxID=120091 RepID=UPI00350EDE8B